MLDHLFCFGLANGLTLEGDPLTATEAAMWQMFANLFTNRQTLRRSVPHIHVIAAQEAPQSTPTLPAHGQAYESSPYVYAAVNRIAEACALVPLRLYQETPDGTRQQIARHPFLDLLRNPNPILSQFELFEQTVGMLELTGNAYWYIAGDAQGLPSEIWTLRPDRVSIVPDAERYIKGYLYEADGQHIALEPVEVIHFKRWHPSNDYYGLSALAAARMAVQADRAMAQWNANTFGRDYGVPAGIVAIKDNITDRDFERLKHEWRSSYGSGQRRTAFLRGGQMEWINIGLNHAELDFLNGRKANREEILTIFGVPLGILSENATEANATVAERVFIERTLYPKLVRLAQRITQELLPFYGAGLIAEFEDIRPTDARLRLDEISTARGILTVDEIRQRYYQLPPLER
ncbi:phage portal protein [Aggregatilineales bacterium SYSU G02658]